MKCVLNCVSWNSLEEIFHSVFFLCITCSNYFKAACLFLQISEAYPNTSENYFYTIHSFDKLTKLIFLKTSGT